MSLKELLNNPNRIKSKLTSRNRIKLFEAEMQAARESIVRKIDEFYFEIKPGILSIVGTGSAVQRQAFGYYLNQDKLDRWIIIAAGRSGRFDEQMKLGIPIKNFVISAENLLGKDFTEDISDWLETYLVICDGLQICSTPKGQHVSYARHGKTNESQIREALSMVEKLKTGESNG